MTPAYMPFTYLSASTARLLSALVGPVVVYQPLKKDIPESLTQLASQGLVEIRTPILRDDDRLRAALAEFTEWARMNPGKSTPGAGFISTRQGEIPFFDETAVSRIRSAVKRYHSPADQPDQTEGEFSTRLFLALAQANDMATDSLDHDLNRFKAQENDFLDALEDADTAAFNRQGLGGEIWRDDPGAKLTGQRIRAWAALAAADKSPPELLITTSPAVIDTLLDTAGEALGLAKLADLHLSAPAEGAPPALGEVLADLAARGSLPTDDLSSLAPLNAARASEPTVTASLFLAANRPPATVIRQMVRAANAPPEENGLWQSVRHTVIAMVKGGFQVR